MTVRESAFNYVVAENKSDSTVRRNHCQKGSNHKRTIDRMIRPVELTTHPPPVGITSVFVT